ncbi:MAG TPA: hypothetical protein VHS31_13400 [Tepidisphaeraceae bacterium]|nr:hypothetical protein [Tepidisphaeraceae bacterium]
MNRWIKRSLLGVALVLSLVALFLAGGFVLLRGTPTFYRLSLLSPEQRADAAARAESKLSQMQNLAADTHGAEVRALNSATMPATLPGARTFIFTADEMNALFNKWADLHGWKDLLDRIVEDPMIALEDGRVIFAGKVRIKNVETIVSIHFRPIITSDGRFEVKLESILGGKLPLPKDEMVSPMRDRVQKQILTSLPFWQNGAAIAANGAANEDAMKAALGKLLLNTLADEPGEPALFLPLISHGGETIPVKLLNISVTDNTLSLTVIPMNAPQRTALLAQIKEPAQSTSPEVSTTDERR